MKKNAARYVVFIDDEMLIGPVAKRDRDYLLNQIVPNLRALSQADYKDGPAGIRTAEAPNSTILMNNELYWCAEWQPGLIVVRSSPNGDLAWAAMRSPIPNFGGRDATEEEMMSFDEDAENHQYNLVFTPWDAQFDEDELEDAGFEPAEEDVLDLYEAAMAPLKRIHDELSAQHSDEASVVRWAESCQQRLQSMAGDGIRPQ